MNGFSTLLAKEIRELSRTGRAAAALVLYGIVGLGSPLIARAVPWMLSKIPESNLGGVELIITQEPTITDAMVQYLKNFGMMPLLVVLLSMGIVSAERRSGVTAVILSRPVSRRAYLAAKGVSAGGLHLVGTILAGAGCALYTRILFGEIWMPGFMALNAILFLISLFFVAVTLLASVLLAGPGAAAAVGIGSWLLLMALGGLPSIGRFTPAALQIMATQTVTGRAVMDPALGIGISVAVTLALFVFAERIFARQEIG